MNIEQRTANAWLTRSLCLAGLLIAWALWINGCEQESYAQFSTNTAISSIASTPAFSNSTIGHLTLSPAFSNTPPQRIEIVTNQITQYIASLGQGAGVFSCNLSLSTNQMLCFTNSWGGTNEYLVYNDEYWRTFSGPWVGSNLWTMGTNFPDGPPGATDGGQDLPFYTTTNSNPTNIWWLAHQASSPKPTNAFSLSIYQISYYTNIP